MAFLGELVQYCCKFIFLIVVAVGGVFLGKFLRDKKDAKNAVVKSTDSADTKAV
ncbi:MAG: vanadium nitrogenase [Lachnospiraceae bacterium]|nr:vanadium nitrogenase [Lachnospiraceae bacterium]MEE1342154.1 vanadium nitrogenase [Lachnospiraceae bacterium]